MRRSPSEDPRSKWEQVREKVAAAMIGVMGGVAVPATLGACSVTLDLKLKAACDLRESTVDKGGLKVITVSDAGVTVTLSRPDHPKDEKADRLQSLLQVSNSSPLYQAADRIREYQLPPDAGHWVTLVAEPSGRISMLSDNDALAVVFNCPLPKEPPLVFPCIGAETDAEKLRIELDSTQKETNETRATAWQNAAEETEKAGPALVDRSEFLMLVNRLRAENQLRPLEYGTCAQNMAAYWANHAEAQAVGAHEVKGDTPETRAQKFGCTAPLMENLASLSSVNANELFKNWADSDRHLKNLLDKNIKTVGLYCVTGPLVKTPHTFCVLNGTADTPSAATPQPDAGTETPADAGAEASGSSDAAQNVDQALERITPILEQRSTSWLIKTAQKLAQGTDLQQKVEKMVAKAKKRAKDDPEVRSAFIKVIKRLMKQKPELIRELEEKFPASQNGTPDAGADAATRAEIERLMNVARIQVGKLKEQQAEMQSHAKTLQDYLLK